VSVPPEAIAQPLAAMPSAVVAPLQEETAEEE
jgi:hypothetical protein